MDAITIGRYVRSLFRPVIYLLVRSDILFAPVKVIGADPMSSFVYTHAGKSNLDAAFDYKIYTVPCQCVPLIQSSTKNLKSYMVQLDTHQ